MYNVIEVVSEVDAEYAVDADDNDLDEQTDTDDE